MLKNRLIALLFVASALFGAIAFAPTSHASVFAGPQTQTRVSRMTLSQAEALLYTRPARPDSLSCYEDGDGSSPGCDGYKPPPISACQNVQGYLDQAGIDDAKYPYQQIGWLNLWESNGVFGCGSVWVDAYAQYRGFTVNAIGMWEEGSDRSNYGGLDRMPHRLARGAHESTYMVGEQLYVCYHGALDYTDEYGQTTMTNTDPICIT